MPATSSLLVIFPTSRMKLCMDVYAVAVARVASLFFCGTVSCVFQNYSVTVVTQEVCCRCDYESSFHLWLFVSFSAFTTRLCRRRHHVLGLSSAPSVHPDRSSYHDISWAAWAI